MNYLAVVLISGISTFIVILAGHRKYAHIILKIGKYHIHHSVNGLLLVLAGKFLAPHFSFHSLISAFGLGMYISHIFEEMLINKKRFFNAVFIFVTPLLPDEIKKSNT